MGRPSWGRHGFTFQGALFTSPSRNNEASYSKISSKRWCQAYFWSYLRKPEVFSKFSLKTLSEMLSLTPNMLKGKPLQPWTLFMLRRDKDERSTDLVDKTILHF